MRRQPQTVRLQTLEERLSSSFELSSSKLHLNLEAHWWVHETPVLEDCWPMRQPERETCTTHFDRLQDTLVPKLLDHSPPREDSGHILRIGFDTSHEVRLRRPDPLQEILKLAAEFGGHRVLALRDSPGPCLHVHCRLGSEDASVLVESFADESIPAALHALHKVGAQEISVLLEESLGSVLHGPSEVTEDETATVELARLIVPAAGVHPLKFPAPSVRATTNCDALLIQHRQNSSNSLANEVHDLSVVRELHKIPFDPFSLVQLGFMQEDHFVKMLLQ
mmetsp:Transcript_55954/g.149231  ORF Transcript_55954/g.149231 Transcript_55954/m.149231 type:complete len:279 (-) Transcript_55954:236-1072(-)